MTTSGDIFLAILSFFFPPLGVWVKRGICGCDSLLNILLCCLGYIPGLIHAWYIIAKYPDEYEEISQRDAEGQQHGRVVYVHVSSGGASGPGGAERAGVRKQQQGVGARQQGTSYGTVDNATTGAGAGAGRQNGEGASSGQQQRQQNPPPSYAEAVKGDHKVQGP